MPKPTPARSPMQLQEQGPPSGRDLLWSHVWRVNDFDFRKYSRGAVSVVTCLDRYPRPAKGEQDPIWVLRLLFLPLILAFVLGPLLDNNLRKSLIMSQGDFSIFLLRPLCAASLILALLLLVSPLIPWMGKRRREIPKEEVS